MKRVHPISRNPFVHILLVIGVGTLIFLVSTFFMDDLVARNASLRKISFVYRTSRHSSMLILITTQADFSRILYLVFVTTLLGLYAGYHKERTNSLVPAIVIHLFYNMGGSLYYLLPF